MTIGPVSLSISLPRYPTRDGPSLPGQVDRQRVSTDTDSDIALLLFCLWSALSLVVVHGPAVAVETMGAYLLARYVQDADAFFSMVHSASWRFPFLCLVEALSDPIFFWNVSLQFFCPIRISCQTQNGTEAVIRAWMDVQLFISNYLYLDRI